MKSCTFKSCNSQNLKMLSTGILGRRVLWTRGSKKACATAPATSSVCALVLIKSRGGNDKKKHAQLHTNSQICQIL